MTEAIDIKKTINNASESIHDKFKEILALIECKDKRTKLCVNGSAEELRNYCVSLKTELSKKV